MSGPTLIWPDTAHGDSSEPLLAYSGYSSGQGYTLLGKRLVSSVTPTTKAILSPGAAGAFDAGGVLSAQFVAPDRLYYVGKSREGKRLICLARRSQESWKASGRPVLDAAVLPAWAPQGADWISVLPSGDAGPEWRLWFVAKDGGVGRVGYATSHDGTRWTPKPDPVLLWQDGGSIETISVMIWAGSLRGWSVVRNKDRPGGELVGFSIGPDGVPDTNHEPVAWQAPEFRFGNLPKDAIPIVDARAEPDSGDARHIRLYVTYRDTAGKTAITLADNFPVAGERSPTIFARQVKPLVTQGDDRSAPRRNMGLFILLISSGLLLLGLGLRHIVRRDANAHAEENSGLISPAEEIAELRNGLRSHE